MSNVHVVQQTWSLISLKESCSSQRLKKSKFQLDLYCALLHASFIETKNRAMLNKLIHHVFSFLFSDRQNFLNIHVMTTALRKRHSCKSNNWNQSRLWQYEINAVRKKSFRLMHGILGFGNGLLFKSFIQDFCFPQKTSANPHACTIILLPTCDDRLSTTVS